MIDCFRCFGQADVVFGTTYVATYGLRAQAPRLLPVRAGA
jgi:hypothetical protein